MAEAIVLIVGIFAAICAAYVTGKEDGIHDLRMSQIEMCERCGKTKWGRIDTDTDEVL